MRRMTGLGGVLAAAGLAAGLTMAGTGTAGADVTPPASTWAEIFAPEISSSGVTLCADVPNGSTAQFQSLQLWRCHGYAANGAPQRWQFSYQGQYLGGPRVMYRIASTGSGLCIGLDPNRVNAGTIPGSNLVQESCISDLTTWILTLAASSPDPGNQFTLLNVYDSLSLTTFRTP